MTALSARTLLLLALLVLPSCRSSSENESRTVGDRGQVVIQGDELTTGGLLLDALVHRMPYMQVTRPTGSCPVINLRGQRLGRTTDNAAVYVDGTRMRDTCVLLQILSSDVDRVEMYSVSAGRPDGFRPGPGGLIVVYRRR
jgi:hypothetical protein